MPHQTAYQMTIQGMTCADCEHHVQEALESVGASGVQANYRKGQAEFWVLPTFSMDAARQAVIQAGYVPQQVLEPPGNTTESRSINRNVLYDWVIIGSGSAAFASAIEARKLGARVAMIERSTLGGPVSILDVCPRKRCCSSVNSIG